MDVADTPKSYNVLFLCTGNSARSIMAEAILGRFGAPKFKAFSAGSHPRGEINPRVVHLLQNLNYKPDLFRSKSWDEFIGSDAPRFDFVFTVCDDVANETCPAWPGQPMTAHWGVPDPTKRVGSEAEIAFAFDDAWRMLQNRITVFANLPVDGLDRLALQKQLDKIGEPRAGS